MLTYGTTQFSLADYGQDNEVGEKVLPSNTHISGWHIRNASLLNLPYDSWVALSTHQKKKHYLVPLATPHLIDGGGYLCEELKGEEPTQQNQHLEL